MAQNRRKDMPTKRDEITSFLAEQALRKATDPKVLATAWAVVSRNDKVRKVAEELPGKVHVPHPGQKVALADRVETQVALVEGVMAELPDDEATRSAREGWAQEVARLRRDAQLVQVMTGAEGKRRTKEVLARSNHLLEAVIDFGRDEPETTPTPRVKLPGFRRPARRR